MTICASHTALFQRDPGFNSITSLRLFFCPPGNVDMQIAQIYRLHKTCLG